MKHKHHMKTFLAVLFCGLLVCGQAFGITPAEDLDGQLEIRPSSPTASWPESGQSNELAPNYTATISVTVIESERVGGVNYTLSSGPDATTGSSDTNVVWTENGTTFSITNTAADTASATMTLTCIWSPERGEGGGEGPGPEDIHGQADADVQLLDSVVDWDFDRTRQWADGEKDLEFTITVTDDNGFGLERWQLTEFSATEADPSDPGWVFFPVASDGPAWMMTSTVLSSNPSKGKVKMEYNDGSDEERTSTEEIAFFLVEFITPAGDPVNSPQSSGDGQNEFTFSTASPGVLTLNIKGKVEPSGIAASIVGDSIFEVGEIEGSTMEWAAGNEDGEPTASGDDIVATVTFTNLPASNGAFGAKVAKYHYDGEELLSQEYEVFFPKTADNHPELGPYLGPRPPNWYYYWSQTIANNSNTTMIYDGPGRSTYDFFDNHRIKIRNDASLTQIAAWGTPRGIDTFAWTTAHEAKHHTQLTGFWPNGWIAAEDDDIDWLPNNQETTYMPGRAYDKSNAATFPDTIGYGTDPIPDVEDICMRSQTAPYNLDQLWNNGDADDVDWANPGKNSETSY